MKRLVWRFGSPSTLLFALLLAPLPWVAIQCPNFMTGKNDMQIKVASPQPAPQATSSPSAELPC
jgi:hypothetical protein